MERIVVNIIVGLFLIPSGSLAAAHREGKVVVHKHTHQSSHVGYYVGGAAVLSTLFGLWHLYSRRTNARINHLEETAQQLLKKQQELLDGQTRLEQGQGRLESGQARLETAQQQFGQMQQKFDADVQAVHSDVRAVSAQAVDLQSGQQRLQAGQDELGNQVSGVNSRVIEVSSGVVLANDNLQIQASQLAQLQDQSQTTVQLLTVIREQQGKHTDQLSGIDNRIEQSMAALSANLVTKEFVTDFGSRLEQGVKDQVKIAIRECMFEQQAPSTPCYLQTQKMVELK